MGNYDFVALFLNAPFHAAFLVLFAAFCLTGVGMFFYGVWDAATGGKAFRTRSRRR